MLTDLKTIFLLLPLVLVTKMVNWLPWWSFVVPVMAVGFFVTLIGWKINSLATGFFSGFLIWVGADIYFTALYEGDLLGRVSHLLDIPKILILLLSGILGGLLTGLALYTGKSFVPQRQTYTGKFPNK